MRTVLSLRFMVMTGLFVLLTFPADVVGQNSWVPVGAPTITNLAIQTVGGISYCTHVSRLEGCKRVASGPVFRSGTNLTQSVSEELWTGFCLCETVICDPFAETHVSVLGDLPPGGYALHLYAEDILQPFPPLWPHASLLIAVPATAPTLSLTTRSNHCVLAVAGISNVRYTIKTSETFTNWAAVKTQAGGPFEWSDPILPGVRQRFYRVQIEGL